MHGRLLAGLVGTGRTERECQVVVGLVFAWRLLWLGFWRLPWGSVAIAATVWYDWMGHGTGAGWWLAGIER